MSAKPAESNVKTALRVIEIIELFARETRPLALSEMARLLDAPVSSCLALLRTLSRQGYIYETGRRQGYYPTGRLLAMAQRISQADPILEKVRPSLEELRDTTQETVVFGKLDLDKKVVYVEVISSPHPIRYVAVAGTQRHVHANSIGKALLSQMTPQERSQLLGDGPLEAFTSKTLTSLDSLNADLETAAQRGWYSNMGESMSDVGGIAWPIRISGGVYAISIAGPVYRIEQNLQNYAERLRVACRFIEEA
ncbi:IclR family transcriptional regulator [Alcaligenes aquatilis]|uniref:IclR family transcriptional regulator n=1 Tax=Alcaligenes aquatilis TaxID=323284 RepID=UPI00361ECA6F